VRHIRTVAAPVPTQLCDPPGLCESVSQCVSLIAWAMYQSAQHWVQGTPTWAVLLSLSFMLIGWLRLSTGYSEHVICTYPRIVILSIKLSAWPWAPGSDHLAVLFGSVT
jgi:hypothetical protein